MADAYMKLAKQRELVQWVFGSNAFQNVKIIAFGNFSYGDRYKEEHVLLGRAEGGFRALTEDDVSLWDFIEANMDMRSGCPVDTIMEVEEMY